MAMEDDVPLCSMYPDRDRFLAFQPGLLGPVLDIPSLKATSWKNGRRVAREAAAMPIPGSTVLHIATSVVASGTHWSVTAQHQSEYPRAILQRKLSAFVKLWRTVARKIVAVLPLQTNEVSRWTQQKKATGALPTRVNLHRSKAQQDSYKNFVPE